MSNNTKSTTWKTPVSNLLEFEDDGFGKVDEGNYKDCPRHPNNNMDLYCRDCNALVCMRCIAYEKEHKGHDHVVIQNYKEECIHELQNHQKELLAQISRANAKKDVRAQQDQDIKKHYQSMRDEVKNKMEAVIQSVRSRELQLLEQIDSCSTNSDKQYQEFINFEDNYLSQLKEIQILIQSTLENDPSAFEAAQTKQTAKALEHSARVSLIESDVPTEDKKPLKANLNLQVEQLTNYVFSLGVIVDPSQHNVSDSELRLRLGSPAASFRKARSTTRSTPYATPGNQFDVDPWELKLKLPGSNTNDNGYPDIAGIISSNTGLSSTNSHKTPSFSKTPSFNKGNKSTTSISSPVKYARANTNSKLISGEVMSFGNNEHNQLGLGGKREDIVDQPNRVLDLHGQGIINVAAGDVHTLAINDQGELFTFGNNDMGQLGQGDNKPRNNISLALRGEKIQKISAGRYFSLALTDRGQIYAWGDNNVGQLGLGDKTDRSTPCIVDELAGRKVSDISAGAAFSVCVTSDGEVYSWGGNQMGQLCQGDSSERVKPQRIRSLDNSEVVEIKCGGHHCMMVNGEGNLYTWGWNRYGQLGLGDDDSRGQATCVTALRSVKLESVCAGVAHSIALTVTGDLYTWGRNDHFQLGLPDSHADRYVPQFVTILTDRVDRVFCTSSAWHTIVVLRNGEVKAFGWNHKGQLGLKRGEGEDDEDDDQEDHVKSVTSLNGESVIAIAAGGCHSVVVVE
ncbi:ultraviolet-B receptor [Acrasis kona]|uniref:Ultraviolet-B receptor n=1 Tax=Acrasis kona TaxID=1008807 RepID=A0AAW2ZQR8_9EUKA